MSARDDLSLDLETTDAQRELMGAPAPLRLLECGHTKHTHRTDVARCTECARVHHTSVVRAVLTPEMARAKAAEALRAAQHAEELALRHREAAARFTRFATGGHDHE